ncbi:hypothetical protein, partial [Phocaeicola vulgatus]|uniref:hypothetical protein n=1 Tax=Phocaeicola vulgatus TaxID=821 RepID=UPI003562C5AD
QSEKGKNVRQGHFLLYIHMPHGNTHSTNTLHSHTFFLFSLPFPQRNTESGQGFEREKPHSEAVQDFFRSELAKSLTASECGVTFAD